MATRKIAPLKFLFKLNYLVLKKMSLEISPLMAESGPIEPAIIGV